MSFVDTVAGVSGRIAELSHRIADRLRRVGARAAVGTVEARAVAFDVERRGSLCRDIERDLAARYRRFSARSARESQRREARDAEIDQLLQHLRGDGQRAGIRRVAPQVASAPAVLAD